METDDGGRLPGCQLSNWHTQTLGQAMLPYTNFSSNKPMDTYNDYMDTLLQEIMEMPAEIYDIPEMQQEEKFDVEGYINGNTDY